MSDVVAKETRVAGPILTPEQRKQRKVTNRINLLEAAVGVDKIYNDTNDRLADLAKATGKSKASLKIKLGMQTTVKKTRGANSYNAWASIAMAEANDGKYHRSIF